jgi:hypothetical protein
MHFLPQSVLFKLVREAECALLEVIEDGLIGDPQCLSNSVVIERLAIPGAAVTLP